MQTLLTNAEEKPVSRLETAALGLPAMISRRTFSVRVNRKSRTCCCAQEVPPLGAEHNCPKENSALAQR